MVVSDTTLHLLIVRSYVAMQTSYLRYTLLLLFNVKSVLFQLVDNE